MQTIYYIIIYYYNVKIFRKRNFCDPEPDHVNPKPSYAPFCRSATVAIYERLIQEALQAKASTVRYGSRYGPRQRKSATGGSTGEGVYSPLQSSQPRHMCFCARALRAFGGLRSVAPSAHAQAGPLRGFGDTPALRLLGVGALSCPPCLSLRALSTRAEMAPPYAPFRRHRP